MKVHRAVRGWKVGQAAAGLALVLAVVFPTSHVWAHPSEVPDSARRAQVPTETPVPDTPAPETPTTDPLAGATATSTPVASNTPSTEPTATSTATNTSRQAGSTSLAGPQANSGTILSLVGTSGNPIVISASVRADSSIQNSNLLYVLYSPSGTPLFTRTVGAPNGMDPGDVFNDSWSYSNPPATGTYRVTLCWSTGNAENCDIAGAETQFYSVPTMGWILGLASMGLLGVFLHRRRADFVQVAR